MQQLRVLLCMIIFPLSYVNAQVDDIVPTAGIQSNLHRENIGKLYFLSGARALSELKSDDFLQQYTLTNKSDLYFVAFFDNSITNYLHRIAPDLPADSLVKAGNYQFSLWVDDRLIYQSNLLPGAPMAKIQDTATLIYKPLINNKASNGLWSESFWNRFMRFGGDSALTEGSHLLRMEIRPYLKINSQVKLGDLLAAGTLKLLVARKPVIDVRSYPLNPVKPYSGLAVSTDVFDSVKIKTLKGNIEEGVFKKITSLVVIKKGKILIEEYFNGANRNTLHDTRSVGKSFASTIAGMAIRDRVIHSEKQTLSEFYSIKDYGKYSPQKEKVTIRDLLTMGSAFEGNDEDENSPGNEENMYPTDNWVKFALDLPVRSDSAVKEWHYFTAGVVLLGDILHKTLPDGLESYAHRHLFKPLGITNYKWQYTPQGIPNTAGGLQMNAMDLAKYGQLYKQGGRWQGKQILPRRWVQQTFTRQQKIQSRKEEYYGYLFWNRQFPAGAHSYEAYYCAGNGGNYVIVFKDQPIVIVITATAYGQGYAHSQVAQMLTDYIIPAIME